MGEQGRHLQGHAILRVAHAGSGADGARTSPKLVGVDRVVEILL